MNDHQLLCFLTVTRTLNFTAAAKELYCTQPALSYQIRSLEKELGLDLFTRSTTRVALTDAGRALRPTRNRSTARCWRPAGCSRLLNRTPPCACGSRRCFCSGTPSTRS